MNLKTLESDPINILNKASQAKHQVWYGPEGEIQSKELQTHRVSYGK